MADYETPSLTECPIALVPGQNKRPDTSSPELAKVFDLAARYFALLSDPTRLKILHFCSFEERSVTDIIEALHITQTNASRHLSLLHQAGMVRRRREGKRVLYWTRDPESIKVICHSCAHMIHKIKSEGTIQDDWLEGIKPPANAEVFDIKELLSAS